MSAEASSASVTLIDPSFADSRHEGAHQASIAAVDTIDPSFADSHQEASSAAVTSIDPSSFTGSHQEAAHQVVQMPAWQMQVQSLLKRPGLVKLTAVIAIMGAAVTVLTVRQQGASPVGMPCIGGGSILEGGQACYDGMYSGEANMSAFFVSFGTQWTFHESVGGMLSTLAYDKEMSHEKSMLRSVPFTITQSTAFSIRTRGGISDTKGIQAIQADYIGLSDERDLFLVGSVVRFVRGLAKHAFGTEVGPHYYDEYTQEEGGFLGVAVRCLRTGSWAIVKSRKKAGMDDEVISFLPDDLKPLFGELVTVDIVDTAAGQMGWLAVNNFHLQGSCEKMASEEELWASSHLGDICASIASGEDMATFFNPLGTNWRWRPDYSGAMFNSNAVERDFTHPNSILRSVPFTVNERTQVIATTIGSMGQTVSVQGLPAAKSSGVSSSTGFLGLAIRSVATDRYLLSKRRVQADVGIEQAFHFSAAELSPYIDQAVTLDVVDTYSGGNGWIALKSVRLRGPCSNVEFLRPNATQSKSRYDRCKSGQITTRPSLFCFSVMTEPEVQVLTEQWEKKASIFACNDYVVISDIAMSFGKDPCGDEFYTWKNQVDLSTIGDLEDGDATNSFLNTQTFLLAWDSILASDRWQHHDFITKVDPDCVFFPDRLRTHMAPHVGRSIFLLNCNKYDGRLYGALEVFSTVAIQQYSDNMQTCKDMKWHEWGEDLYMESCMRGLGAEPVEDFALVGDDRCTPADCSDHSRVAYHPYKESADYWDCFAKGTTPPQ